MTISHRVSPRTIAVCSLSLTLFSLADATHGDRRDFPFTYEWRQSSKGEREFEVKTTYEAKDNVFEQELEMEFGVSKRLLIAPYLVFARESGDKYRYRAFQLESRYQLGDYKRGKILPALYAEYVRARGGENELEGRLILSRYAKNGGHLSFNYVAERELERGANFGHIYSLGYARDLNDDVRGGFEWIHNLSDHSINAGPVASFGLGNKASATVGYAFALNRRRENGGQLRLNVEYEF